LSEKGFAIVLKLNLPPEQQYHSGHSIILQADTVAAIRKLVAGFVENPETADTILNRFGDFALAGAARDQLTAPDDPAVVRAKKQAEAIVKKAEKAAKPASPVADDEPAGEKLATKAQIAVAAKKLGKKPAELEGMTEAAAKEVIAAK
jgi:hypothetical protein